MSTLVWPIEALPPRHIQFDISPRTLAAPSSISGKAQVVASDAGIWTATLAEFPVHRDVTDRITLWWAISNLLEGRLNAIVVPMLRRYQPNQDVAEEYDLYEKVPHSDDALFDDGSGYVGGANSVTLTGAVSVRAVSANVAINYGGPLLPGQHFTIGERLYRLRTVVYTTETTAAITFRPPLREAASEGTFLDFDEPRCRMRLASDDMMNLPLEYGYWSFPSLTFIEDL